MELIPQFHKIIEKKGLLHKFIIAELERILDKKITQPQFSKWINGRGKKPDADILWALSLILECKVDDFYYINEKKGNME